MGERQTQKKTFAVQHIRDGCPGTTKGEVIQEIG
jgi:hypothetical protein